MMHTHIMIQLGAMADTEEAARISLVDEVVSANEVASRAVEIAAEWAKVPSHARHASKMAMRKPLIDQLKVSASFRRVHQILSVFVRRIM